MSNEAQQQLVATKFEGHKAPVLSLAWMSKGEESNPGLLLSGSEDRTARLWDLRDSKRRASLCIPTQGEVLSVAFEPPKLGSVKSDCDEDVDSPALASPFAQDHTIFLSMDQMVLEYDLRQASGPILTSPTRDLSSVLQNQDEVNQLSLAYFAKPTIAGGGKKKGKKGSGGSNNKRGSMELYLASADDAGTIRCMPLGSEHAQVLHHDTNGVAVVPACAFRPATPATKTLELVSGGTDCKIHLWDVMKPKKPISSFTIQQPESGETSKPQVCNPPMVYSLAWSRRGKTLAAGLGDGNIPLFSIENRTLVQTGYLSDGHDSSVASVVFPSFGGGFEERLVMSGGSDGSILCWDVGSHVVLGDGGIGSFGEGEEDEAMLAAQHSPASIFAEGFLKPSPIGGGDTTSASSTSSKVLFGIPHGQKVNWMTTSTSSIFVADTSHDITEYKVPLR